MAKIMYGNYNDLPWMPNHKKDVDGKVMRYMKCFAMEAANLHMCMGKMYNGMPIGPHTLCLYQSQLILELLIYLGFPYINILGYL